MHNRSTGTRTLNYTIIDPVTGAGAYKIGGGENGGILVMLGLAGLLMVGIGLLAFGFVGLGLAMPFIFAAIALSLGNLLRGLSLLLEGFGYGGYVSSTLCNLATYSYTAGLFTLLGRFKILSRVLGGLWSGFFAGAGATALLTPACT